MKKIAIIGGGISGLAALHFLKQRLGDSTELTLLEKDQRAGGKIQSRHSDGVCFEIGPNGFLDNQPATLRLIDEVGLTSDLIEANTVSKRRYIQMNGVLHKLPMDPVSLVQTPLLTGGDKGALIRGLFRGKVSTDQSIHDYACQRFSTNIAERFFDPFITGVFAGNTKRLHMGSAFPKIGGKKGGRPKMRTLRKGMGQLLETLADRYRAHIKTGQDVASLSQVKADVVICSTPAPAAAAILESVSPELAQLLRKIRYVPVMVVGLVVEKSAFDRLPDGFGYLIPSGEKKDILGVLLESNVFENRAPEGKMLLRVMMGGSHHPEIMKLSSDELKRKALNEVKTIYGLKADPVATHLSLWPEAIPQYELDYPALRAKIDQELKNIPHVRLLANYLGGISSNDCIANALQLSQKLSGVV